MPTTSYDFIDSALDADEGWSTFGAQERGTMPMLQPGVNGLGALASEPQAFRHFSNVDQHQIVEEIEDNPRFGKKLTAMLHRPNGSALIAASAKRAILNEMYPKQYPESKGEWTSLRKRFRTVLHDVRKSVNERISRLQPAQRIAIVRTMARGGEVNVGLGNAAATAAPTSGTGSIWGDLIGGIASAAASIYSSKITADAQKDLAKIQAQNVAAQNAAAAQIAANQAAIDAARAKAGGGTIDPVTGQFVASSGFPLWVLPIILGVVGLGLYFVLR